MPNLVKLDWLNPSTALITMNDISTHNTLSADLITDLKATFTTATANSAAKVIIFTGLDQHFCYGNISTQLDLTPVRELLLNCELPIIAAVQGNALGDGLVLATYADIIIFAEQSCYSATYLEEGHTPGSGATYIIPKKFGPLLGAEILYTGQSYTGSVLIERNIPLRIVNRENVLPLAQELAKDFNDKLEPSIRLLKKHLNQIIKSEMVPYINEELA